MNKCRCLLVLMLVLLLSGTVVSADTFGVETKDWSGLKLKFNDVIKWSLEYKRYDYSDWTYGNQYLHIYNSFDEYFGFWKIKLVFDCPVHVYSARFTLAIDYLLLDSYDRDDYCTVLNYSGYSCFFNWSDLASIPGLSFSHGVQNDVFWFRFQKNNIPAGTYVFDPTFGFDEVGAAQLEIEDRLIGYCGTPPSDGTTDNITVCLRDTTPAGNYNITCGLYLNSTKALLAQSEERHFDANNEGNWLVFNISYNVTAGTEYLIVVTSNLTNAGFVGVKATNDGNWSWRDNYVYDGTLPDPTVQSLTYTYSSSIYCSYTASVPTGTGYPTSRGIAVIAMCVGMGGFVFSIWALFSYGPKSRRRRRYR